MGSRVGKRVGKGVGRGVVGVSSGAMADGYTGRGRVSATGDAEGGCSSLVLAQFVMPPNCAAEDNAPTSSPSSSAEEESRPPLECVANWPAGDDPKGRGGGPTSCAVWATAAAHG